MAPPQETGEFEAVGSKVERAPHARSSTDGSVAAANSVEVLWEIENTAEQAPAVDGFCTD